MNNHQCATQVCRMKVASCWLWMGLIVLIVDQLTKGFVYSFLPVIDSTFYWYPYGGVGVFQNLGGIEFSINHMTNAGAAWGVLANHQLPLIILRVALIVGLCIYLFYYNRDASWQFPLVLIIAGALGNVLDFFIYGHVVDMFHFVLWGYDFPVFNIADSAISLGICSIFLISWLKPKTS